MNSKRLKLISKIAINISGLLFGFVYMGGMIANENANAISQFLNAETERTIQDDEDDFPVYYESVYESIRDLKNRNKELARQVVSEGSVLLKNENNALPLSKGNGVSLFSSSSANLVYAGSGSSNCDKAEKISLKEGLESAGLSVNQSLWDWYASNRQFYGTRTDGQDIRADINDAFWNEISTSAKSDKNFGDAAIFVLSRFGGEGEDMLFSGGNTADMTEGDYLRLSPKEIDVLSHLKEEKAKGTFKRIVLLLNSANQVQLDFADDYGIDAILWIGEVGTAGTYAVGDLLVGKENPSGRLSDTFWKSHRLNPVNANFGITPYSGDSLSNARKGEGNYYVVYQEGIYNGYRYTETRYEDSVLKDKGNLGAFSYEDAVAYPFGYGLSYSTFSYSNFQVVEDVEKDRYQVSVTVTNNGPRAGKDVVEIYLQKPYTDFDAQHGVEKAAVELVGFAKTRVLDPSKDRSQTLTIDIDKKYFASYCSDYRTEDGTSGAYLLEEGKYYLALGTDAHDATNNILASKNKTVDDGMTENGDANFVYPIKIETFDAEKYSVSRATGRPITNRFDSADINRYAGAGSNRVDYITRSNWAGTVTLMDDAITTSVSNKFGGNYAVNGKGTVRLATTEQMIRDAKNKTAVKDDREYPKYGQNNHLSLVSLRAHPDEDDDPTNDVRIPYDDPKWDQLLDQLTWEETVTLLSLGDRTTYSVKSINKPQTIDHNGSLGPVATYNYSNSLADNRFAFLWEDEDMNTYPVLNPCNGLVASTYNTELIEEFGVIIGENCLWAGYSGLYGPGINIHRGVYNGRAFEYYSEDPYLTGKISSSEVRGIQSMGCYTYLKHCLLNEQESAREGICTWANEQTIREIYLRPFEIAIEEGEAYNIMTSFNRIGVSWSGEHGFINTVIRDEFGMKGFAISDYWQSSYMSLTSGILNGNDLPDGSVIKSSSAGYDVASSELNDYKTGYGEMAWAMRESAHRILYTVVHSNAMNGFSSGTRIIQLIPVWQKVVTGTVIGCGILFGTSVVMYGISVYLEIRNKRKKEAEEPVA